MERGACEETRATETVDIRKQGCLINKGHTYSISRHAGVLVHIFVYVRVQVKGGEKILRSICRNSQNLESNMPAIDMLHSELGCFFLGGWLSMR